MGCFLGPFNPSIRFLINQFTQRVAFTNATRGFLREQGYVCGSGETALKALVADVLADEAKFSGVFRDLLLRMLDTIGSLQDQIDLLERQIRHFAKTDERCKRIQEIDGIGPISATALIVAMGSPANFKNGRHFSAWLGLVPKQSSSGNQQKLLGLSKRGDAYLRSLLIHGARAAIQFAGKKTDYRSRWVIRKVTERGKNKAVVALANRNARVAWVLLAKKRKLYASGLN